MSVKLQALAAVNVVGIFIGVTQQGWFGRAKWTVPEECEKLTQENLFCTKRFYYEHRDHGPQTWSDMNSNGEPLAATYITYVHSPRFLRPVDLKGKVVPVLEVDGLLGPRR